VFLECNVILKKNGYWFVMVTSFVRSRLLVSFDFLDELLAVIFCPLWLCAGVGFYSAGLRLGFVAKEQKLVLDWGLGWETPFCSCKCVLRMRLWTGFGFTWQAMCLDWDENFRIMTIWIWTVISRLSTTGVLSVKCIRRTMKWRRTLSCSIELNISRKKGQNGLLCFQV